MENKSEKSKAPETAQEVDSRIAAVRDLIFGENIQQYNTEFEDVYNKIKALQNETQKNLGDAVTNLENKLADLESLMDHKFQDLNDDLDKRLADLDDEKADRRKLGKALEKIALMLQELMKKQTADNKKDNRFELLRELLLEDDREKFTALSEEIIKREKLSKRVDPLVDEKIEDLRENFPKYFGGTITETIKVQIRDSQDEVVEALYPIMGKLVKKAIVSEVTKLSDKINKTIQEKFSFKQLFTRFIKGKKNDADVVLQEVFEPVVEEVFIIEKDSGLLSGSYTRGNIADKDMVSGMLTAIKSFAEEAFSKEDQNLEDIKFDNFQLTIKNFKTIYIAIATSGILNVDFKDKLSDNVNNLAEIILRDRAYLSDEVKLNVLIERYLID